MFEQFLEKSKNKWVETVKTVLADLEQDFKNFWKETIEEASKRKIELEQETEKLNSQKIKTEEEVNTFSNSLLKLSEAVKREEEKIQKYEARQQELMTGILEIENREKTLKEEESAFTQKEINLLKMEDSLKMEKKLLEERERSARKVWEKVYKD